MSTVLILTHTDTQTHRDKQSADGGASLGKVNSAEKHAKLDCLATPPPPCVTDVATAIWG